MGVRLVIYESPDGADATREDAERNPAITRFDVTRGQIKLVR